LVTDTLKSYDAAHRTVMPTVEHLNITYANKRAEVAHQPTRQQEYSMRGFASLTTVDPTILDTPRPYTESLSPWSALDAGHQLSFVANPSFSGLKGNGKV